MSLRSIAAAIVVLCTAVAADPVPFKVLDRGDVSLIEEPRTVVVRTANDWKALNAQRAGRAPSRSVDFSRSTVIGVFLGTRPSGGFSVEITGIERQGKDLIVTWREKKPGADQMVTQVLTAPYQLVTIDKFDGPVKFARAE